MRQYTHVGRPYNVGHGWVLVNLAYFGDVNLMLRDNIHAMGSSSNIHAMGSSSNIHARGSSYNIHARGSSYNIHTRGSSYNVHAMGSSCLTRTFLKAKFFHQSTLHDPNYIIQRNNTVLTRHDVRYYCYSGAPCVTSVKAARRCINSNRAVSTEVSVCMRDVIQRNTTRGFV